MALMALMALMARRAGLNGLLVAPGVKPAMVSMSVEVSPRAASTVPMVVGRVWIAQG